MPLLRLVADSCSALPSRRDPLQLLPIFLVGLQSATTTMAALTRSASSIASATSSSPTRVRPSRFEPLLQLKAKLRDRGADYTAHFADPDVHLDWCDILQVILPTASSALPTVSTSGLDQAVDGSTSRKGGAIPTCPICLSEPTAARMVRSFCRFHSRPERMLT